MSNISCNAKPVILEELLSYGICYRKSKAAGARIYTLTSNDRENLDHMESVIVALGYEMVSRLGWNAR